MTDKAIEIALVLYPGVQQAAVLGITDLLATANRMAALGNTGLSFTVSQWQLDKNSPPKKVATASPDKTQALAAVILPPTLEDPAQVSVPQPFIDWLNDNHSQGSVICSICGGAFLLAQSGMLQGRTATTHWMFSDQVASRYPEVRWDTERLIVDDGDIITAGGAMSWTDLGLRLVAKFLGPRVMLETARTLLIDPPGREQRYYRTFSPKLNHGDKAILKVQHWLQSTDAKEGSVPMMAEKAGLEQRTFLRRFQKATGLTSTDYCQHVRVSKAQNELQLSRTPIETIAWQVGYKDPASFRKVFTRIVGLGPGEYRKRFGVQNS
ncbi:GlxA family transcriptional regulator [Gilvimarinus chinensis]|uniref:GlxA family transcriptional regulator n=1 Tax=Gilvimarinus chinensis TaxID=396005 RepID=UPI00037A803A|nr:helix-turn-helix domain-containing protein [Gilvimarinus chinensis]